MLPPRQEPGGVALVVTLMMMSILTMMVVGLSGVMRSEQAAARNLTYQVLAEQMAEIGAQEAMARVLSNSPVGGVAGVTGPGWTLTNGVLVPLFSSNAAGQAVNLEAIGTNSLILSQTSPVTRILAHWSNVVAPGSAATHPVGRYAWWVDDEGTKGDLNATAMRNTNLFPLRYSFPLTTRQVLGQNIGNFNDRTNFLFTPEFLKEIPSIDTSIFPSTKGHITTWSAHQNLNPWGQPKVPLSQLSNDVNITNNTAFSNLIEQSFAHSNLAILFGRDYVDKYGNGNRAVGSNVIRQILANGYEATLPTNSTSRPLSSATGTNLPVDYMAVSPRTVHLNEVPIAVSYHTNAGNNRLQLQIWVMPEILRGHPDLSTDMRTLALVIQMSNITLRCRTPQALGGAVTNYVLQERTNFWDGGNPNSKVTNGTFESTPVRLGRSANLALPVGFYTNRTWALFEYTFRDQDPNQSAMLPNAGYATDLEVTVQVGEVTLFQRFGGISGAYMAVDWLDANSAARSFSFTGNQIVTNAEITVFGGQGTMQSISAFPTSVAQLNPPGTLSWQGLSKNDPRSRAFPGWSPGFSWSNVLWSAGAGTPGSENTNASAFGLTNLVVDIFSRTSPVQAPSATNEGRVWYPTTNWFPTNMTGVPSWGSSGTNLPSVAALGNLHTGLPWRTLRLSAQEGDANPPDWFLAELFTAATNPTASAPRINVNNRVLHAGGWENARIPMALALLSNLTNGTGTIPTNLLPLNPRWTSDSLTTLSNNLSNRPWPWVTGSTWGQTRAAIAGSTNTNVILFASELAEVDGLGNTGNSNSQAESALMAALDLLTTRSDTFTVWSAGQGLVVFTNTLGQVRTNVMGEVRKQTVFQRSPLTNATGQTTNWQLKVLFTKDHVVE